MAIMIVLFIVVSSIVSLLILLVYMNQQEYKKKQAAFLVQFTKLGSRYGLSFTSQELMPQRIIGLDGIMQKMLVFETGREELDWYLINLKEVKSCTLKTILCCSNTSSFPEKCSEGQVEIIALEFAFKNGQQTVLVPFYEYGQNEVHELSVLNNKAKDWEMMLSKMLTIKVKRA